MATIYLDKKKLICGMPSTEMFLQISNFVVQNEEPIEPEDFLTFPLIGSDNLIHENLGKWDIPSLEVMAATFAGKDLMLDHEWDDSDDCQGFIADTELWHVPTPSPQLTDYLLSYSVKPSIDAEILKEEGYYQFVAYCAIEATSEIAADIRFGRKCDVSIGGFSSGEIICPICKVPFDDPTCPHYIPQSGIENYLDAEQQAYIAPYFIRSGFANGVEISFVVQGNCRRASILKNNFLNLLS